MNHVNNPPLFTAKIKVVKKNWHGWSPDGANISPTEIVYEQPSGSRLVVSDTTHKMVLVWGEDDKNSMSAKRVDYKQTEGFRIFISKKQPTSVIFRPERILEPISGQVFPVYNELPLEERKLKIGENNALFSTPQKLNIAFLLYIN